MKKLLIFLVLVGFTQLSFSQSLIQTFTDRCTGATQVFSIAMQGPTTIVFYNKSKVFNAGDVSSGVFQAWLEETYAWWLNLSPCSTNQSTTTNTQTTTTTTTSNASNAANNATNNTTNTSSTSTTSSSSTSSSSSSSNSSGSSDNSGSSGSSDGSSDNGGSDNSGGESGGGEGEGSGEGSGESEGEGSGESEGEGSGESEGESEEKQEEEKKEEEKEKEEGKEEEKKEKEEEEEKKLAPPIISTNLMTMQMLDGTLSTALSFGISQSSLTGVDTYSLNGMVWSNMKQFMLGGGISTVYFDYDKEVPLYLYNPFTNKEDIYFGSTWDKGSIRSIDSHNINLMYMFGTTMASYTYSEVYMGQKDNLWKGSVGGFALTTSILNSFGKISFSNSITGFGTKPLKFKKSPRWIFSPMLAISLPVKLYSKNLFIDPFNNFTYIIGNSTNFQISQRFIANLGITVIGNTDPLIPFTFAATIGSRFAF